MHWSAPHTADDSLPVPAHAANLRSIGCDELAVVFARSGGNKGTAADEGRIIV